MFRAIVELSRLAIMRASIICLLLVSACSSPEQQAQEHYERGLQLMETNQSAKAQLEFLNAVKLNDKLTEAWLALANISERNQRWAAATKHYEKALELDPELIEPQLKLARFKLAAGEFDTALEYVNKAKQLKPKDADVLALQSTVLLRLNDREGARLTAERALAINPDNSEAHAVLAADRVADGDSKGALLFLDRALSTDPDNVGLIVFRMGIYEKAGDLAEVEAMMRRLIEINPEIKQFRKALIGLLTSLERATEAETEIQALIALDPSDAITALELVKLIQRLKGNDAAREQLQMLIQQNPKSIDYRLSLALFDVSNNNLKGALGNLETIITEDKIADNVNRAKMMMANIALLRGETDRADELVAQVISEDSKNVDALEIRARLKLRKQDIEGAILDLREALDQQPQSIELLRLMGRAQEQGGQVKLARSSFNRAIRAANFEPRISIEYADFLVRHADNNQAELVLTNAVSRNPTNAELLTILGRLRLRMQNWIGAQAAAEELEKIGAISAARDQILGTSLMGQRRYAESISAFQRAYEAASQAAPPMYSLVRAYMQGGKVDDAKNFLRSVLSANPDNADAHVLSGSISSFENKPDEAEASYQLAIKVQPNNPIGYRALAEFYIRQAKLDEARSAVVNGRNASPGDVSLGMILAAIYQAQDEREAAISVYEELVKTTPNAPAVLNDLASLLSDYRTDQESLERAAKLAKKLERYNAPLFKDTLGWIAYRQGNLELAETYLTEAARELKDTAVVQYHLGMVHASMERKDEARKLFGLAEKLAGNDTSLQKKIRDANRKLD